MWEDARVFNSLQEQIFGVEEAAAFESKRMVLFMLDLVHDHPYNAMNRIEDRLAGQAVIGKTVFHKQANDALKLALMHLLPAWGNVQTGLLGLVGK